MRNYSFTLFAHQDKANGSAFYIPYIYLLIFEKRKVKWRIIQKFVKNVKKGLLMVLPLRESKRKTFLRVHTLSSAEYM